MINQTNSVCVEVFCKTCGRTFTREKCVSASNSKIVICVSRAAGVKGLCVKIVSRMIGTCFFKPAVGVATSRSSMRMRETEPLCVCCGSEHLTELVCWHDSVNWSVLCRQLWFYRWAGRMPMWHMDNQESAMIEAEAYCVRCIWRAESCQWWGPMNYYFIKKNFHDSQSTTSQLYLCVSFVTLLENCRAWLAASASLNDRHRGKGALNRSLKAYPHVHHLWYQVCYWQCLRDTWQKQVESVQMESAAGVR